MMKRWGFFLLLLLQHGTLRAADNYLLGARPAGIANAAVTLSDAWSVSHNQAGLGTMEHAAASVYFENRFLISELALKAFAFALPVKGSGTFAISASQFGYSKYNESKAG